MKMKNTFNLPLYLDSDVVRDSNNDWLVSMDATDEDEAIVIAINHHDELVQTLTHSTERLSALYKNTGSLGCRAQMEFNQLLLSKIEGQS
jgi:hypothetical protein